MNRLLVPALAFLLLFSGCSSNDSTDDNRAVGYTAAEACQDISAISYDYFSEFDAFRYGTDDGSGWAPLRVLTDKASVIAKAEIITLGKVTFVNE